jgi:energy-coupling factor transporter ATPase
MIQTENLDFHYSPKGVLALSRINLTIEPGEYLALIGPNGCGKTTLVKHCNALLTPSAGKIWVDRMDTADPSLQAEIRRRVGMVFQNPDHQIVGMTVEEDVAFGPGNLELPSAEIQRRVDSSLATVGLNSYGQRPPHSLSGGEKRLVAIAGVLAMDPQYMIFDEPTSYLDAWSRGIVLRTIQSLNRQGMAVIHITHNMEEILQAHRVVVLNQGQILYQGTPREVFQRTEWLKALHLDVPRITELMERLQKTGADVRTDILTVEEACSEISDFWQRPRPSLARGKGGPR